MQLEKHFFPASQKMFLDATTLTIANRNFGAGHLRHKLALRSATGKTFLPARAK
jgi:hypothetical protein